MLRQLLVFLVYKSWSNITFFSLMLIHLFLIEFILFERTKISSRKEILRIWLILIIEVNLIYHLVRKQSMLHEIDLYVHQTNDLSILRILTNWLNLLPDNHFRLFIFSPVIITSRFFNKNSRLPKCLDIHVIILHQIWKFKIGLC